MHRSILHTDAGEIRLPPPNPSAALGLALLWLVFACALPLYQLREARLQAHRELQHLLTEDKPDNAGILAAFDRSNQTIDAAASGPCLILAFTIIFLGNQMLRLKGRYSILARRFSVLVADREAEGLQNSND